MLITAAAEESHLEPIGGCATTPDQSERKTPLLCLVRSFPFQTKRSGRMRSACHRVWMCKTLLLCLIWCRTGAGGLASRALPARDSQPPPLDTQAADSSAQQFVCNVFVASDILTPDVPLRMQCDDSNFVESESAEVDALGSKIDGQFRRDTASQVCIRIGEIDTYAHSVYVLHAFSHSICAASRVP